MGIILLSLFSAFIGYVVMLILNAFRRRKFNELIDKIPGPPAIPIFGNAHSFPLDRVAFSYLLEHYAWQYAKDSGLCRIWIGNEPIILVTQADAAEVLLSSNIHIKKSSNYDMLVPWLGTGLLISTGEKWRRRRKMLTPTFHFSILNSFVDVYNEHALQLRDHFMKKAIDGTSFDVYSFIGCSALDIICESAMGVSVGAQKKNDSEYVMAVKRMSEIIFRYERSPWLWLKPIFYLTGYGFEYDHCLKVLKGFTSKVIQERSQELRRMASDQGIDLEMLGKKLTEEGKRLAFLDMLLIMQNENNLTYEDIREEVDTFMFEGHDTTAAGMSWALFILGHHPEVQSKIYDEMKEILGEDPDRMPEPDDLKKMRYLEAVIKESLRLFPSVPVYARRVEQSLTICGYEIPVGSTLMLATFVVHRDPHIYGNDADEFKPQRFLDEPHRHPYAFIPFSAGPRNCIGQRFAMNEMKVILSTVIRNFTVHSLESKEAMRPIPEVILRPPEKFLVRVEARNANVASKDLD